MSRNPSGRGLGSRTRRNPHSGGSGGGGHERWLVSYADLITLLLALFVVMYASSVADAKKFKTVAEGLRRAFAEGVVPQPKVELPGLGGGGSVGAPALPGASTAGASSVPGGTDPALLRAEGSGISSDVRDRLLSLVNAELGAGVASEEISTEDQREGLLLKLGIRGMFPAGKAQADPDLVPLLDKIGAELKASGARVRIEGRTEISEPGAGWALAAERAAWVADRWIQKGGWEASRIAVVSLGGVSAPPGQAGSEAERALQRRVDIRVLPEK